MTKALPLYVAGQSAPSLSYYRRMGLLRKLASRGRRAMPLLKPEILLPDAPNGRTQMFQISRRDLVLGASAAYAMFGLSKPIAFIGAAEAQQMPPGPGFKKYKV